MSQSEKSQLRTGVLGLWECVMIGVGGMVGSCIFTLSGVTYGLAGPAALVAWVIAAAIIALYALNIAELSSRFPQAGGLYAYPAATLSSNPLVQQLLGWLASWSWVNVTVLGTSFGAIFVAGYLDSIIPGAKDAVILVGLVSIVFCWIVNYLGISLMGRTNLVLTALLMVGCLAYSFAAFPHMDSANFSNFWASGAMGKAGIMTSIPMAMLAYGSVIAIASLAEEAREPRKTIPKAIVISLGMTTALYLVMLIATFGVVSWTQFTPDSFAYYAPMHFAATAFAPGSKWVSLAISLSALFAIVTTMLVLLMSCSRTLMGVSEGGLLPAAFRSVNKNQVPGFSLTISALAAAAIACFPQFTMEIIGTGSLCSAIVVVLMAMSLIAARTRNLGDDAAYQVPGGIALPLITIVVVVVNLVKLPAASYMLGGWWYLIGLVIFAFGRAGSAKA